MFFHESPAQRAGILIRYPVQIGHKFHRPKMRCRIAMALQTPSHAQRLRLIDLFHRIDSAMARDATDTTSQMRFMVEIDVIRKVVYTDPWNRFARCHALPDGLHRVGVGRNGVVAVHANRRRRNRGEGGPVCGGVTIAAIHAHFSRMNLVRERHGLLGRVSHVGGRWRSTGIEKEQKIDGDA